MLHPPVVATDWTALPDFSTSSSLPLTQSNFSCILCTSVCFCVCAAQIPKPWGSNLAAWVLSFTSRCQTSPPLPALFIPTPRTTCTLLQLLAPPFWEGALPLPFHHPSTVHSSNHDALASTLSKWVMRRNYGVISGINADWCNLRFLYDTWQIRWFEALLLLIRVA